MNETLTPVMEPKTLDPKAIGGWAIYDLANTIFSALYLSLFFPFLIKDHLGGTEAHVGYANSICMLLVGLTVPFLGTASDLMRKRMPILICSTIICCIATAFTPFYGFWPAIFLFVVANYCYQAALTVYNAILPDLGPPEKLGRISSIGVGVGYIGTLLGLGMVWIIDLFLTGRVPESEQAWWLACILFPLIGLSFIGFSLWTFFTVRDQNPNTELKWGKAFQQSRKIILGSIVHWKRDKQPGLYLLSQFFYSNAINTIIIFLPLIATKGLGFTFSQFIGIYAILSVGTAIGTLALSGLCDSLGSRKILIATGIVWIAVLLSLASVNATADLWLKDMNHRFLVFTSICVIGGVAWGLLLSAQRPMLLKLVPLEQAGEYFGYLSMVGKFSGVFGTALFGVLATTYNYNVAMLSLTVFFVLGLLLLLRLQEPALTTITESAHEHG